jgi:hypothetical protein
LEIGAATETGRKAQYRRVATLKRHTGDKLAAGPSLILDTSELEEGVMAQKKAAKKAARKVAG